MNIQNNDLFGKQDTKSQSSLNSKSILLYFNFQITVRLRSSMGFLGIV